VCQRKKHSNVWSDISMDFIGGLPKPKEFDVIYVVVDHMTKYAHFFVLAHPFTMKDVVVIFLKEVVHLHGFPSSIVFDRNKFLLSTFWSELFKPLGTSLKMSSTYNPQTDHQTEAINKCLETYLRYLIGTKAKTVIPTFVERRG